MASGATTEFTEQAVVDHMVSIEEVLHRLDHRSALQLAAFCRRRLDAAEARVVADRFEAGDSDNQVEDLFTSDGKTSKREAKKRSARGKAVNANPDIADRMASGNLSTEQADIVADAASETDGAAACDEELLDVVSGTTPEQGKRKARDFVARTKTNDEIETVHRAQRRRRTVYRTRNRDGDHQLVISGDEHSIDQIERRVNEGANAEYKADGGRDVPRAKHPRTNDQRRFDAAHRLLVGRDSSDAPSAPGRRSTIFVTATTEQIAGADSSVFRTADGRQLPRSVIEELLCHSELVGQVYSEIGELLWQGRRHRHATPAQVRGLIARDEGCVLCGTHPDTCVAHHILPWESPGRGRTDIDNLALLCESCHRRIHRQHLTLVRDMVSHAWTTRDATPDELPPDGPRSRSRPDRKRHGTRTPAASRPTVRPRSKPRIDELRRAAMRAAFSP